MTLCAMCRHHVIGKAHIVRLRWSDEEEPFRTVAMCSTCFDARRDALD